jgi:hypothetical protein
MQNVPQSEATEDPGFGTWSYIASWELIGIQIKMFTGSMSRLESQYVLKEDYAYMIRWDSLGPM